MTKDRGFNKLKGETIKDVSATTVNQVTLLSESGWIYMIDADVVDGIPVMTVKRHKEVFYKIPTTRLQLAPKKTPPKKKTP